MSDRKIITTHVYPPIPVRHFDWCAHFDGEEESGCNGWGKTEAEAIADLNETHGEPLAEHHPLPARTAQKGGVA